MKVKSGLMLLTICASLVAAVLPAHADAFELIAPIESSSLQFQDELIVIRFLFAKESGRYKRIVFRLVNISDTVIAIDWNGCSLTSPSGEASGVVHEGVRFMNVTDYIPPTTIPPGSRITDSAIPTSSVSYSSSYGWTVGSMYLYEGAEFGLYLSLTVGEESRGYNFRFRVKELAEIAEPSPMAGLGLALIALLLGLVGLVLLLALAASL